MPPSVLPRAGYWPIFDEKNPITLALTATPIPLTVRKEFPLKDQPAPEFVLSDHMGRQCSLHATIQLGRPIILFFFPLAGSPHCTAESCLFRDAIELTPIFSDLQAIVIGISQDPPSRAKKFVDEHRLTYRILYDEKRQVMERYGVSRTTFGLVDNRCTFIIDPSGIIRGLAEGVMNSVGHLKFAEKWLIRLEHELSERSKQYLERTFDQGDMIAAMDKDMQRLIQVVYGDERSASSGGIGGVPRFGAASKALPKSAVSPRLTRTKSSESLDSSNTGGFEERMKRRERVHRGAGEKNLWKSWKHLLSQLSSPDGVPPPILNSQHSAAANSLDGTNDRPSPASSERSKRSGWNNRNNLTRTLSRGRRKKEPVGKKTFQHPNADVPPSPPVPTLSHDEKSRRRSSSFNTFDGDSDGMRTYGTDASVVSSRSTGTSSFGDHSRGPTSSLASPLMAAAMGSFDGHGATKVQLASPSVTSEVLMGGSVVVTKPFTTNSSGIPLKSSDINGGNHHSDSLQTPGPSEPRRSVGPNDVPEDAKPEEDDIVGTQTPRAAALLLPQTPAELVGKRANGDPANWIASSSADTTTSSRPGSAPRRVKRVPPPVVSSQYHAATWENAFGRNEVQDMFNLSSDSDLTVRGLHGPAALATNSPTLGHVALLAEGRRGSAMAIPSTHPNGSSLMQNHSPMRRGSSGMTSSSSHPYVNGHGRENSGSRASNRTESPLPGQRGHPLVLQSLSTPSTSQSDLTTTSQNMSATTAKIHRPSQDSGRPRAIPKMAPPPVYPPPLPPSQHTEESNHNNSNHSSSRDNHYDNNKHNNNPHGQQQRSASPRVNENLMHKLSISPPSQSPPLSDSHSPTSNALGHGWQSSSRRPSMSESIQSAGTFG